jgi:hypothetical protein
MGEMCGCERGSLVVAVVLVASLGTTRVQAVMEVAPLRPALVRGSRAAKWKPRLVAKPRLVCVHDCALHARRCCTRHPKCCRCPQATSTVQRA